MVAAALAAGVVAAMPGTVQAEDVLARHDVPIGVQLYTLGDLARTDLTETLRKLGEIGYRTLELAGYHGHTPAQLRAAADAAGLRITSIHLGEALLGSAGQDLRAVADQLALLGQPDVVMPMFLFPAQIAREAGEPFGAYLARGVQALGVDHWKRTAAYLNERGAALHRVGLRLGYHNHNIEFAPVDGTSGWDILVAETDPALVAFEVDAGWVAAAGRDPVQLLQRHGARVRQMHAKDIRASTVPNFAFRQDPTEVGSGMIDWKTLLPVAYRAGVRQFYVEQEPPFVADRFASLATSFRYLKGLRPVG